MHSNNKLLAFKFFLKFKIFNQVKKLIQAEAQQDPQYQASGNGYTLLVLSTCEFRFFNSSTFPPSRSAE